MRFLLGQPREGCASVAILSESKNANRPTRKRLPLFLPAFEGPTLSLTWGFCLETQFSQLAVAGMDFVGRSVHLLPHPTARGQTLSAGLAICRPPITRQTLPVTV